MDEATGRAWLQKLIDATTLLTREAAEQKAAFPDYVVVADELALNFHDAALLTDQLLAEGLLTEDQGRLFAAVDRRLQAMSDRGRDGVWTDEALVSSPEWREVRELAVTALQGLGVAAGRAHLEGITYVRGAREGS